MRLTLFFLVGSGLVPHSLALVASCCGTVTIRFSPFHRELRKSVPGTFPP